MNQNELTQRNDALTIYAILLSNQINNVHQVLNSSAGNTGMFTPYLTVACNASIAFGQFWTQFQSQGAQVSGVRRTA